ncbi:MULTISPECIES: hypothetical protein [Elizabethkingia]|uniref:Lipoprotein n=2 Tax=Elizabethkingia anophelis TaxID=1117645 RepID=A0A455ZFW6_9FLAO|nr:hypothetical protein [Elizabethkingia anophelis]ATC37731.1 hypothetical protein BAZ09_016440 [Elizabethkingia anophelis R26]ATC41411.1 hypothetical protein EAAG1_016655 [Elizabethkingia anophelis Ag1]ATC45088.1 hypothetical protein CMV41_16655 [Elizabethkingia anophelis]ATC48764.1 hypothetical protein CMV40_16655 [Elizabethkingia anophelis]ELR81219.1 hypothetical protein D505_00380 [Elizabethkingia anophelis R26]
MKSKIILLLIVIITVVSCADRDTEENLLQQKANKTARIKTDSLQSVKSIINQKAEYETKAESEAIDPDKYIPIKH